jgi:hypothetical protein
MFLDGSKFCLSFFTPSLTYMSLYNFSFRLLKFTALLHNMISHTHLLHHPQSCLSFLTPPLTHPSICRFISILLDLQPSHVTFYHTLYPAHSQCTMHATEPDNEIFRTVISSGEAKQLKQSSRNSPTKKGSRGGEPRTRAPHAVPRGQRQVFDFHDPVGTKSETIGSKNPSSTTLHTSSSSAAHRTCSTMLSSSTLDTAISATPGVLGKGIVLNGCKDEKSKLADNAKRKSPKTKSRGGQPRTRAPHAVPRGQRSVFDFYDPVGTKHETTGSKNPSSTSLHTSSSSAAHRACSTMVSCSTLDTATSVTPGNMGKDIVLNGCKDEKSTLAGNVKRKLKTVKGQNSQPNSGDYVSSNLNWSRPKQLKKTPVPHTPEFAEKVHQRLFQGYKTKPATSQRVTFSATHKLRYQTWVPLPRIHRTNPGQLPIGIQPKTSPETLATRIGANQNNRVRRAKHIRRNLTSIFLAWRIRPPRCPACNIIGSLAVRRTGDLSTSANNGNRTPW